MANKANQLHNDTVTERNDDNDYSKFSNSMDENVC